MNEKYLLDLFITHWTEPWEVGEPGFKIISIQRLVDWNQIRITLVHDGTEKFPDEYFKDIPCGVRQVVIPHGGIAAARNWCIDHAEGKWIRWHDFDDMLANVYSLWDIMNVLPDDRNQMLWFDLLWQDQEENRRVYLRKERNPVFIHNKIFRTSFLKEKGLRFNEELTWCEDSAFLALCEMEIDHQRIGKITECAPIYVYRVRDGSLCHTPEIKFANLKSFFKRHCYVAEEFLKHGHIAPYNTMIVRIMGDSYYTVKLAPDIFEDRRPHEKTVFDYFDQHRDAFYACTPEDFDMALNAVNRENFDGGEITKDALMEWIHGHERGDY